MELENDASPLLSPAPEPDSPATRAPKRHSAKRMPLSGHARLLLLQRLIGQRCAERHRLAISSISVWKLPEWIDMYCGCAPPRSPLRPAHRTALQHVLQQTGLAFAATLMQGHEAQTGAGTVCGQQLGGQRSAGGFDHVLGVPSCLNELKRINIWRTQHSAVTCLNIKNGAPIY